MHLKHMRVSIGKAFKNKEYYTILYYDRTKCDICPCAVVNSSMKMDNKSLKSKHAYKHKFKLMRVFLVDGIFPEKKIFVLLSKFLWKSASANELY